MFSEAEQRRLAEIEALLRVDDPGFVQRFEARWGAWRKWKIVAIIAFVTAVTVTLVALIAGSVGGTFFGLAGMGVATGVWLSQRIPSPSP
jgi:hypothetical protein